MSHQPPLRILTVAPQPATRTPADILPDAVPVPGGGWLVHKWHLTHADRAIRSQAREFIRAIIDVGGGFKAPAIIGSMQGKAEGDVSREQALSCLGDALTDLGAHAARYGVPLLYDTMFSGWLRPRMRWPSQSTDTSRGRRMGRGVLGSGRLTGRAATKKPRRQGRVPRLPRLFL